MPAESLTHIPATFLQKIRLDGFLSFAPGSDALELRPLNVLIGPNASGKSNLIEAFELLRAMPTNFASNTSTSVTRKGLQMLNVQFER